MNVGLHKEEYERTNALGKPPALAGRLELIVRLPAEDLIANSIANRSFILLRRP